MYMVSLAPLDGSPFFVKGAGACIGPAQARGDP
jgi:hypothetical protein